MQSAAILDFALWKKCRDIWEGPGGLFLKQGP